MHVTRTVHEGVVYCISCLHDPHFLLPEQGWLKVHIMQMTPLLSKIEICCFYSCVRITSAICRIRTGVYELSAIYELYSIHKKGGVETKEILNFIEDISVCHTTLVFCITPPLTFQTGRRAFGSTAEHISHFTAARSHYLCLNFL